MKRIVGAILYYGISALIIIALMYCALRFYIG